MKRPFIIGITGGSGSGKTFFARKLLNRFSKEEITLLSQDNYYKAVREQKRDPSADGLINFDHPHSLNVKKFISDLVRLSRGEILHMRKYTFNNPNKSSYPITVHPAPIIITDGIFLLYSKGIRRRLDIKIFMEATEEIKFARRLKRDMTKRKIPKREILMQYERYVAPMYKKFIAPYKKFADLVIFNGENDNTMDSALEVLTSHLKSKIKHAS